jgi:hypothetical protein
VLVNLCLSWILAIGRRGVGAPVAPLRLELVRSPTHREILEAHFGCRVKFKPAATLWFFGKAIWSGRL